MIGNMMFKNILVANPGSTGTKYTLFNKKKEVLSKFGSNLRLKDKSLYFIRDYRSLVISEWHRLYRSKKEGFEPEKSLILKDETLDLNDFEAVTSRLLSSLKFVRT